MFLLPFQKPAQDDWTVYSALKCEMRPSELQNSGVEVNGIDLFTKKNLCASFRRWSLFEKEATVIDPRYCNTI